MLKQSEVAEMLKKSEAFLTGHFLLTSGLHSPNYLQCAKVLQYPEFMTKLCMDLVEKITSWNIDLVIGPAMGGIVPAVELGRQLNVKTVFSERVDGVMALRRGFELKAGQRVVIVEDVLTTGRSIKEVNKLITSLGGIHVGTAVIVDRSSENLDIPGDLASVMQMDIEKYTEEECPLCKQGLELVKPGSRPN